MDLPALATVNIIILAAVLTFALGTWVYFENRRDSRNVTFAGLLAVAALWAFSFVFWQVAEETGQVSFWLRTLFFIGSLLPALAFLSVEALYEGAMPSTKLQLGILAPNAVLFWVAYATPLLAAPGGVTVLDPGRGSFALHFAIASIVTAGTVLRHRKQEKAAAHGTRAVMVGTAMYFLSVASVLFFADLTKGAPSLFLATTALIISMFMVATTLIHRRFLVDLRLIGVEMFILMALLVIIMNIVVSESVLDFTVRLVILIVLAFYGALTTKTMVQEVGRLREIESLQKEVMAMNGRLIEADKMKTRFVSFASHQLRAPIGGVRAYLEVLLSGDLGKLNDRQMSALSDSHDAMVRMHETVETFLDVAKIQMGKLELFRTKTDLEELAKRVVSEMTPLAEKKGLTLAMEPRPGAYVAAFDSGKIYHVLLNLIDNAIKYTEKGNITVRMSREKDSVVVRVKDTGVGIAASDIRMLFTQFSRGAEGIRLDPNGSGLGLFLATKIVEAHGGEVLVTSPGKGKGSTFGFRLPIVRNSP